MVSLDRLAFLTAQAACSATSASAVGNDPGGGIAVAAAARGATPPDDRGGPTAPPPRPGPLPEEDARARPRPPIHFCFIVHGHQGRPSDLSYLHRAVKSRAGERGMRARSSDGCVVGREDAARAPKEGEAAPVRRGKRDRLPFSRNKNIACDSRDDERAGSHGPSSEGTLVVHNVACNEGKTNDGIAKGGERLVREMLEVVRSEVEQNEAQMNRYGLKKEELTTDEADSCESIPVDVTISIIGNSLGGLYARYAVAELSDYLRCMSIGFELEKNEQLKEIERRPALDYHPNMMLEGSRWRRGSTDRRLCMEDESPYYLLDNNKRIHFNVFCSTASPHLGCAGHTYLPLPRLGEVGVARAIGETGSDLFRLNDLVHKMATSRRYLEPLASFRRRIAYANAYGTDFPVPGATAAFLDKNSDYPHFFDDHFAQDDEKAAGKSGEGGAAGSTSSGDTERRRMGTNCPASERGLIAATLRTPRLPSRGSYIQSMENTDDLAAMSSSLDSMGWTKVFVDMRTNIPLAVSLPNWSQSSLDPIRQLRPEGERASVRSRDLERAVSTTSGGRLGLPLGHNAICAFSRGRVSTLVNSGGRPVMDSLAANLIDEISSWNGLGH